MKRLIAVIAAVLMICALAACETREDATAADGVPAADSQPQPDGGEVWKIALLTGGSSDARLSHIRRNIERRMEIWGDFEVEVIGGETGDSVPPDELNALIAGGYDLVVARDVWQEAGEIIGSFKDAGIPLITYNSFSPADEEMELYPGGVFFVGSAAEESGIIQGEAAVEYWNANPYADRNENGVMDYVMLRGLPGFYNTIVRAQYAVYAVEEAGIEVNAVADESGEPGGLSAKDQMNAVIAENYDDIEVVFANDDEIALGAVEALKEAGFFEDEYSFIPVLGVGADVPGMTAVRDGTLLATALDDPVAAGEAICAIARCLKDGKEVNTANLNAAGRWMSDFGLEVDGFGRVWTHYRAVTAENADAVMPDAPPSGL